MRRELKPSHCLLRNKQKKNYKENNTNSKKQATLSEEKRRFLLNKRVKIC